MKQSHPSPSAAPWFKPPASAPSTKQQQPLPELPSTTSRAPPAAPSATSGKQNAWVKPQHTANFKEATNPALPTSAATTTGHEAPPTAPTKRLRDELRHNVDAYVVLDFEATCEKDTKLPVQEIIEFPMVVIDARTGEVVGEFQRYVRPVHDPKLSTFCTQLTGITQNVVDKAQPFPEVFAEVVAWLSSAGFVDSPQQPTTTTAADSPTLPPPRSLMFVTCGDWDLDSMLPRQLASLDTALPFAVPSYFSRWINIKHLFCRYVTTKDRVRGMEDMLRTCGLQLEGRHHSGIDDCRNIARILQFMLTRMSHNPKLEPPTQTSKKVPNPPGWPWCSKEKTLDWSCLAGGSLSEVQPPSSTFNKNCTRKAASPDVAPPTASSTQHQAAAATAAAVEAEPTSEKETAHRRALALLLSVPPQKRQPNAQELTGFSKKLSLVLRHRAEELGIPMSSGGMVSVAALMKLPYFRYMDLPSLAVVVRDNDKQRFRLRIRPDAADKALDPTNANGIAEAVEIAANQGHSIQAVQEEDLKPVLSVNDCPVAVHGTYLDAWKLIQASGGLSRMTRKHVHFAKGLPGATGVISGMRSNVQVLLYLDVDQYLKDGGKLFESVNGVILAPGMIDSGLVPLKYIKATTRNGDPISSQ